MTTPPSPSLLSFPWGLTHSPSFCPRLCRAVLPGVFHISASSSPEALALGPKARLLLSRTLPRESLPVPGQNGRVLLHISHTPPSIREQSPLAQLSEYAQVGPLSPPPSLPAVTWVPALTAPFSPSFAFAPLDHGPQHTETRWTLLKRKSDGSPDTQDPPETSSPPWREGCRLWDGLRGLQGPTPWLLPSPSQLAAGAPGWLSDSHTLVSSPCPSSARSMLPHMSSGSLLPFLQASPQMPLSWPLYAQLRPP